MKIIQSIPSPVPLCDLTTGDVFRDDDTLYLVVSLAPNVRTPTRNMIYVLDLATNAVSCYTHDTDDEEVTVFPDAAIHLQ